MPKVREVNISQLCNWNGTCGDKIRGRSVFQSCMLLRKPAELMVASCTQILVAWIRNARPTMIMSVPMSFIYAGKLHWDWTPSLTWSRVCKFQRKSWIVAGGFCPGHGRIGIVPLLLNEWFNQIESKESKGSKNLKQVQLQTGINDINFLGHQNQNRQLLIGISLSKSFWFFYLKTEKSSNKYDAAGPGDFSFTIVFMTSKSPSKRPKNQTKAFECACHPVS